MNWSHLQFNDDMGVRNAVEELERRGESRLEMAKEKAQNWKERRMAMS